MERITDSIHEATETRELSMNTEMVRLAEGYRAQLEMAEQAHDQTASNYYRAKLESLQAQRDSSEQPLGGTDRTKRPETIFQPAPSVEATGGIAEKTSPSDNPREITVGSKLEDLEKNYQYHLNEASRMAEYNTKVNHSKYAKSSIKDHMDKAKSLEAEIRKLRKG